MLENNFILRLDYYDVMRDKVRVYYSVQDLVQRDATASVRYALKGLDNKIIVDGEERILVESGQKKGGTIVLSLPQDVFGELNLEVSAEIGSEIQKESSKIFVPSNRLTGFSIYGADGSISFFWTFIFFLIIGVAFVIFSRKRRRILSEKVRKGLGKRFQRDTIDIEP